MENQELIQALIELNAKIIESMTIAKDAAKRLNEVTQKLLSPSMTIESTGNSKYASPSNES